MAEPGGQYQESEREEDETLQDDLRQRISALLLEKADLIAVDSVAMFPYSGTEPYDGEYCRRLGDLLLLLLTFGVREGRADPRGAFVADLHRTVLERSLPIERLFTFMYLTERTVLDEVALSDTLGATSEPWPVVAQLVRRASFDVLGAYTERAQLEPTSAAVIDRLTTLYTRPMFDAVLVKELERSGRFGSALSLILFDVDHLADINAEYGYGVGDKVLERLGILARLFFRHYDWVARHSEDSIAVLLTDADAANASELAERMRTTVEERLEFMDHRTDRPVHVTISAAIVNLNIAAGDVVDIERFMADAEAALDRAKRQGRNRVERLDGSSAV